MSRTESPVEKLVTVLRPVFEEQTNAMREHVTAQHQELLIKMMEMEHRIEVLSKLLSNSKPKKGPKKDPTETRPGQFDVEFD